jgi:putative ABC transport system ATP-binding protein
MADLHTITTTHKEPIIVVENVEKTYFVGGQAVNILKGVSVTINKGDFFVIFGPSGCGKSTLLHSILGLDKPTKGSVIFSGHDFNKMNEDEIATFRKVKVGLVFQASYWVKSLTVIENVAFPLFLMGKLPTEAAKIALEKLTLMGMENWVSYSPAELSSGQQQKVGLARALVVDPDVIVADEPTGNLDSKSGEELMELLLKLNKEQGKTILMVTHDLEYMKYANRVVHVMDGVIVEEFDGDVKNKVKKYMVSKRGAAVAGGTAEGDIDYLKKTAQTK